MRNRRTYYRSLILCALVIAGAGCSNLGLSINELNSNNGAAVNVVKPFDSFSMTTDQNAIMSMCLEPNSITPPDYGFDEAFNGKRGEYRFDSARRTMIYERSLASGSAWNDFNIFPPDPTGILSYKLNQIKHISLAIKSQLNANGMSSQCGLVFGFGDTPGHVNASGTSTNLRLAGRDWSTATNAAKNPRDYFRFAYEANPGSENFTIDAPMNSFNQPNEWDRFTAAQWTEAAGDINIMGAPAAGPQIAGRQERRWFGITQNRSLRLTRSRAARAAV